MRARGKANSLDQNSDELGELEERKLKSYLYYQDGWATIYHADCRDILPLLLKVDLVLTDPPYGLKWGGTGFSRENICNRELESLKKWDKKIDSSTLKMILSKCRNWIIWGGNYYADVLGPCRAPLVWDKKAGNSFFADGEMAFTSLNGTLRIFHHQWCGAFKDSERNERTRMPTQKPVALFEWCIEKVKPNRSILDPFLGSGTTCVAAKNLNLKSVGIEIEEKRCEIAAKRVLRAGSVIEKLTHPEKQRMGLNFILKHEERKR